MGSNKNRNGELGLSPISNCSIWNKQGSYTLRNPRTYLRTPPSMYVRPYVWEHVYADTLTVYDGLLCIHERCKRAWLEKRECIGVPIRAWDMVFYLSANCELPLQGGFRLARRLVTRQRSSWCVAASRPYVSFYVLRNNFILEVHKVHNTRIH